MNKLDYTKPMRFKDTKNKIKVVYRSEYLVAYKYLIPGVGVREYAISKKQFETSVENCPETHKLTGWVNVYKNGDENFTYGMNNKTRKLADMYRGTDHVCIACLDLSKYNLEFEEGEGL